MPPSAKGWAPISVRAQVLEKLQSRYESKREELEKKNIRSFNSYVTDILAVLVERDEILARYAPFMSEAGIFENRILIDDKKKGEFFEVVHKNKELFCRGCERSDCLHVGFAYSIPLVNKTLREEGAQEPKLRA